MKSKTKNKIPSHAKKVFQGEIFEIWQWEQEMYDGTRITIERAVRPDVVEVIATVGKKIVITQQEQPLLGKFYSLPGGTADHGNDHLVEAKRELLEETGYGSNNWAYWKEFSYPSGRVFYEHHYFIARDCKKIGPVQLDSGEKIKTKLISFDDFLKLGENPSFRGYGIGKFLLEMMLNKKKRETFHKLLFGKK